MIFGDGIFVSSRNFLPSFLCLNRPHVKSEGGSVNLDSNPKCTYFPLRNTSSGVRYWCRFLGLVLSSLVTLSTSCWLTASKLAFLGKNCRYNPFVFSFVPRSQEW